MYFVLVADDEPLSRSRLVRYLCAIPGVAVTADVRDGTAAIAYLQSNTADAVITDIRMPNMNGLQLTEYLSRHRPELGVALVSAYDELEYARAAMRFGVEQYLIKPIHQEMVQQIVDQLKNTRRKREAARLYVRDLPRAMRERALTAWFSGADAPNPPAGAAAMVTLTAKNVPDGDDEDELMTIALDNIVHWAVPQGTAVLVDGDGGVYRFAVIAGETGLRHVQDGITDRIDELLGGSVTVKYEEFADSDALRSAIFVPEDEPAVDAAVAKAKAFISAHLADPISRQDVAEAVFMDSSYFSRYFKKKTGVNFRDYLQNERIARVKALLKSGAKVQDACEQAGFHDRKYFNELFKEITGVTPSEYRRSDDGEG